VSQATQGKETFTMYCYANIGVPKNPGNPLLRPNQLRFQPGRLQRAGRRFHRLRPGRQPEPGARRDAVYERHPRRHPEVRGLFKAPSLRNVDQRPYPGFVKSYMHNGVFKSLEEVVHFYNKRNIATNSAGVRDGL
jgi:cytochrome c peroxidase